MVVNKFDGDLKPAARRVAADYTSALKFMPRKYKCWRPRVRMISSLQNEGIDDLWDLIQDFKVMIFEFIINFGVKVKSRRIVILNKIPRGIFKDLK